MTRCINTVVFIILHSAQKKIAIFRNGVLRDVTFRKILLNKCQKEFERGHSVKERIGEEMQKLAKEGLSVSALWILFILSFPF